MRRGVSLVEVLVVIAVIAVIIGLVLPVLGPIRQRSQEIRSISRLKQIGQTTGIYVSTYRAYYFGRSGVFRPESSTNPGAVGFEVWSLDSNWPLLVHEIAPWRDHSETWVSPGSDLGIWLEIMNGTHTMSRVPVSYRFAHSFLADPGVWDTDVRVDQSAIGATREGEVAFPSSKVVMYDAHRMYLKDRDDPDSAWPVLFVDGSAHMRDLDDAAIPVQNQLRPAFEPEAYHDTPRGVEGRDY